LTPRENTLPKSSREVQEAIEVAKASLRVGGGSDPRESELESEILLKTKDCTTPFPLLIVEDEAVYRNGVIALLDKNPSIARLFEVLTATRDTEALRLALEKNPSLIIQDVDLGPGSKNGIEIVRELRSKGFRGKICIHSNRFLMEDTKTALDAGADTVLPKPLGRAHFLKLLSASLPLKEELKPSTGSQAPKKPTFAYVDDSLSFLIGMRMKVKTDATLHEFKSTGKFFERVEKEPDFLSSLDFLVTDFHFDASDRYNGLTFAEELRKMGFRRPILLASGADIEPEELAKAGINGALPKVISGWDDLKEWSV
jgi:CheY-like chemotaxis protein